MHRPHMLHRALLATCLACLGLTACAASGSDGLSDPDDDLAAADRDDELDADTGPDRRGLDPAARAAALQERLGLDDGQTAEVEQIFDGTMGRMKALRERGKQRKDGPEAHQQMRELHEEARLIFEEQDERMRNVLGESQYQEYAQLAQEHRKQGKHGKHAMHGKHGEHGKVGMHRKHGIDPAELAKMLQKRLGLDDHQRTEVERVFAESASERAALETRGKTLHTEMREAHEAGDERVMAAKHEQLEALHGEHQQLMDAQTEKLRPILNDEQLEGYREMVADHGKRGGAHHGRRDGVGPHHSGPHHGGSHPAGPGAARGSAVDDRG